MIRRSSTSIGVLHIWSMSRTLPKRSSLNGHGTFGPRAISTVWGSTPPSCHLRRSGIATGEPDMTLLPSGSYPADRADVAIWAFVALSQDVVMTREGQDTRWK